MHLIVDIPIESVGLTAAQLKDTLSVSMIILLFFLFI